MILKTRCYFNLILVSLLLIASLCTSLSFAQQTSSNEKTRAVTNLSLEQLQQIALELKYYDEVLTASVLNYAFFGEEKWLDRYHEYEPKLTLLLNALLVTKRREDLELLAEIDSANTSLVSLELRAIEAVKNNSKEVALNILNSAEYRLSKDEYMSMLMSYIVQVETRTQINKVVKTDEHSTDFTEAERKWIAENKVIVGIDHWPPLLVMQNNNTPGALTGEIFNKIVEESGLQVEYVGGSWNELVARFNKGDIDVLPDTYMLEERKEFGYFSRPYYMVRELFYVKDGSTQFQNNDDLSSATIAIPAGFTSIDKLKGLYPDINIIETTGTEDSISKVVAGKADALLDAHVVVDYLLKENNIKNLRLIDEDVISPSSLHIFTTKHKKILHNILEKGLALIQVDELIHSSQGLSKSLDKSSSYKATNSKNPSYIFWFIIGTIVTLVLLGTGISSMIMKIKEEDLVVKFSSSSFKKKVLAGLMALAIFLIVIVSFVDNYAEKRRFESLEYSLKTLLSSTHERMKGWIKYELNDLEQVGKNKELIGLVEKLLLVPEEPNSLKESLLQSQIRQFFKVRESEFGHIGFFIISPNKISLSSRRDNNIGTENIISKARPELLAEVMRGKSVFIPTIRSGVHLVDTKPGQKAKKPPTMFFAAPIIDAYGDVIAIVTKRINFEGTFSSILSAGFLGKSGETYAIDKSGVLLSNVRFEDELRDIGLIDKNNRASLNIRVTDPGKNLLNETEKTAQNKDWPLTLMASHISSGLSGYNIEGYRDYRGVKVIGSWMWDDELHIGIVAELDMAESLELLMVFRYTIFSILFISLLLVFAGTLFTLKIGTRATKALARSQIELEDLVGDRTAALEANMKRTRIIIDNASDGIIMVDEKGVILEFSPAAETIFGYSISEVLGKNIDLLMNESFHKVYIENQKTNEKTQDFYELIGCKSDKELMNIEVAVGSFTNDTEQLFTGIVRDSTVRKKVERELNNAKLKAEEAIHSLAEQVQFQQLLMDSVPIPLFYKDADTKFQGFNKAYEETFGVNSADLIGLKVTDLAYLPKADRLSYQAEDIGIISQQKTIKREMKLPFADGEQHDVLYWVTGFSDSKNNPAGLVGNFIDITNEKENARQLEVAVKSADEANQSKADFLANMSHEIRTPMNAIIGMSYLALQTTLNRKQEDYVNKIHSSANALLGIINDILDFSKIEAGKLEMEAIPFNLNETIEHLVQIISHKSQEKELELLIDLDPELPLDLIGDSLRLGQILINLANNSIKFTNEGEIIVRIKKLKQDDNNVTIEFSVCDSGIGMTEEQVSRLFQSFSQADASTTRKYGGTGLGLTICKSLTAMMQGEIWVESKYGEGSQFFFTATFGLADQDSTASKTSIENLSDLPVLIVDDSIAARDILFNLSESLGFKSELAASGEEALEKLTRAEKNNNPFKLVLSDWKMPNMDGIELGDKISQSGFLSTSPKFVIVTAYDRDEMLKKTGHIKLASSMTKPVTASTLLDTTLRVMGQKSIDTGSSQVAKFDLSSVQGIAGAEILLVEDNEINQQIAVELLEMAGLVVTVANNGKFAVEAIEHKTFDAVLMDIQMPVMDGYTATQEIRKDDKNASLPIIAMTANAMSGDREKCIAAGMNEHLAKPIDPQEMYKTIAQWVEPTGKSVSDVKAMPIDLEDVDLPVLPRFDIDSALARMAGNVKAYRSTLKKVAESESDAIQRLRLAINDEDYKTAVLVAHTLKGVAGNIGASFVAPSAEQLELLFTDKIERGLPLVDDEIEALLIECEIQLVEMIVAIENDQQTQTNKVEQKSFDADLVAKLLTDLKVKIEGFDSAAIDTLQEILDYLPIEAFSDVPTKLAKALESYDFDSAEQLVLAFEQELNSNAGNSDKITDEEVLSKLALISEQINNFDSTVVDAVDDLLEYEHAESLFKALEKMRDSLSQYDFDNAEEQLNQIKSVYFNKHEIRD